jgi:hypothetical protein
MKTNTITKSTTPALLLIVWLLVPQTAHCFYSASTGRWLTRDPLNAVTDADTRYKLFRSSGQTQRAALVMAQASHEQTDYVIAKNALVRSYDLLGLCVPLPDSAKGSFHSRIITHLLTITEAGTLTFNVCCPTAFPYLATWGITSSQPSPATTGHAHNFPADWWTATLPTEPGPCYKVAVFVTTTSSLEWWLSGGGLLWDNFVDSVRVTGGCCCTKPDNIQRQDPPPLPPRQVPIPDPIQVPD